MAYLSIAVLGSPLICYGEQEIHFSTRKQLALLLYLAVEGGRHSRQSLSELFWPELDAEHARSALRTTLRRLREQLADASRGREYLLSDRTTLGLAPDAKIRLMYTAWRKHGTPQEIRPAQPSHYLHRDRRNWSIS